MFEDYVLATRFNFLCSYCLILFYIVRIGVFQKVIKANRIFNIATDKILLPLINTAAMHTNYVHISNLSLLTLLSKQHFSKFDFDKISCSLKHLTHTSRGFTSSSSNTSIYVKMVQAVPLILALSTYS